MGVTDPENIIALLELGAANRFSLAKALESDPIEVGRILAVLEREGRIQRDGGAWKRLAGGQVATPSHKHKVTSPKLQAGSTVDPPSTPSPSWWTAHAAPSGDRTAFYTDVASRHGPGMQEKRARRGTGTGLATWRGTAPV